jgi:hypothetical protein
VADETYPWLPSATVMAWLKVAAGTPGATIVETCRQAAADWIEDQRPDLHGVDAFEATPRIVQAGVLAAARLHERAGSAAGLVSFGEFGAASILRSDPDITRMLGRPRPVTG